MRLTRRAWLAAALPLLGAIEPPDDAEKLLSFAKAWNEYVGKLQRWIRDRRSWRECVRCWERL